MSNADNRGRFVWHDLMTTDTKAAGSFYSKVVGWRTQPWDKNPDYILWVGAKGPLGGLMALPQEARTAGATAHWLGYILTGDLDASLQTAQRLGARVLKATTEIPTVGRFAVLADPQGASFCLFAQAPAQPGSSAAPLSNDFSWHELASTDPIASMHFYGQLCGWETTAKHDMGPAMGIYYLVGMQGIPFAGMYKIPADKPMAPSWLCYIDVADIDKAANAAKASGGKVTHGPVEVPGGTWIAQVVDPQGARFAAHALKRVSVAAPAAPVAKPAPLKSPPPPPPPAKPQPPAVKAPTSAPAASPAPAAPKPAAKAPPAPKAAAAPAKKKAAKKKAAKKKPAAKKKSRPKKSKAAAKKAARKSSSKRKGGKKRAGAKKRRSKAKSGFAVAKRFAKKQAGSLLKRLRGRKHR